MVRAKCRYAARPRPRAIPSHDQSDGSLSIAQLRFRAVDEESDAPRLHARKTRELQVNLAPAAHEIASSL